MLLLIMSIEPINIWLARTHNEAFYFTHYNFHNSQFQDS